MAEAAHRERARLLRWILAHAGLSAAWTTGEGENPTLALTVAAIAAAEIAKAVADQGPLLYLYLSNKYNPGLRLGDAIVILIVNM